jgi:hypothetical protein
MLLYYICSQENKPPTSSLRKLLEESNSRPRSFSIAAAALLSAPVILMAFNDESMCFVAWIRLSVAASQTLCWTAVRFPIKVEATVQTMGKTCQLLSMFG